MPPAASWDRAPPCAPRASSLEVRAGGRGSPSKVQIRSGQSDTFRCTSRDMIRCSYRYTIHCTPTDVKAFSPGNPAARGMRVQPPSLARQGPYHENVWTDPGAWADSFLGVEDWYDQHPTADKVVGGFLTAADAALTAMTLGAKPPAGSPGLQAQLGRGIAALGRAARASMQPELGYVYLRTGRGIKPYIGRQWTLYAMESARMSIASQIHKPSSSSRLSGEPSQASSSTGLRSTGFVS